MTKNNMTNSENLTTKIDEIGILPYLKDYLGRENPDLFSGIQHDAKHFYTRQDIDPKLLTRITGPEEDMIYSENINLWNERVNALTEDLKLDINLPPIIVIDFLKGFEKRLIIGDGNHRFEALKSAGLPISAILCLKFDPRIYSLGLELFK